MIHERLLNLPSHNFQKFQPRASSWSIRSKDKKDGRAKAIEHYEKFLDLWKDADPGIAEVEDARKRLARLKYQ